MADILADTQVQPAGVAVGQAGWFVDSTAKIFCIKDDTGIIRAQSNNAAIAAQGAGFAADTYVTNSDLLIPSFGLQAKTTFRWRISVSKTAAGVAAPAYQVRVGAARTVADTSRLTINGPAQTAVADVAVIEILLTVRSIGAAGVIQGTIIMSHNGAAVGFANNDAGAVEGTSAGFDMTVIAGQFIGLSINGGAAAAWTITQVRCEAVWN